MKPRDVWLPSAGRTVPYCPPGLAKAQVAFSTDRRTDSQHMSTIVSSLAWGPWAGAGICRAAQRDLKTGTAQVTVAPVGTLSGAQMASSRGAHRAGVVSWPARPGARESRPPPSARCGTQRRAAASDPAERRDPVGLAAPTVATRVAASPRIRSAGYGGPAFPPVDHRGGVSPGQGFLVSRHPCRVAHRWPVGRQSGCLGRRYKGAVEAGGGQVVCAVGWFPGGWLMWAGESGTDGGAPQVLLGTRASLCLRLSGPSTISGRD